MKTSRLEFLDGLRGIAISLVMLLHYWEITWFDFSAGPVSLNFLATTGSMGVTLFFFISGFCLYLSYDRDPEPRSYARKRFFKIFPSYLAASIFILAVFGFPFQGFWNAFKHLSTHLLFIHNWWSDTYGSINGVFWSLAVEVQFYFLFPFLFPLIKRWPAVTLVATYAVSQAVRVAIRGAAPAEFDGWMNQLPALLDIFVGGIAAAVWYSRWSAPSRRPWVFQSQLNSTIVAAAGLAGAGYCFYLAHFYRYDIGIPQIQTWLRGGLLVSFVALSLGSSFGWSAWNSIIANPVMKFLSRISYNLYIWHQFIGYQLFQSRIPEYVGDPHTDKGWQIRFLLLAVPLSILVAWLITRFFEEPILRRFTRKYPAKPNDVETVPHDSRAG